MEIEKSHSHVSSATIVLVFTLLAGNIFLGFQYYTLTKEVNQYKQNIQVSKTNDKIIVFTNLFIDKVLKSKTEVNFETRLKLENAVRDLDDAEVLAQWTKFIDSKDEANAQEAVKNLLSTLVNKIKY